MHPAEYWYNIPTDGNNIVRYTPNITFNFTNLIVACGSQPISRPPTATP